MAFDACVATMGGAQPSGLVRDGAIGVTKGKVAWIGRAADVPAGGAGKAWNIGGKVLTPDTHIVLARKGWSISSAVGRRHALGSLGSRRRRRRRAESAGPHEMVGHLVRNAAEAFGHPPQPIVSLGGTDTLLAAGWRSGLRLWLLAGPHWRHRRKRQYRRVPSSAARTRACGR